MGPALPCPGWGPSGSPWDPWVEASQRWIFVQVVKGKLCNSQGCPGMQDFLFPCSGHSIGWAMAAEFGLWKDDSTRDPVFLATAKFKGKCLESSWAMGILQLFNDLPSFGIFFEL